MLVQVVSCLCVEYCDVKHVVALPQCPDVWHSVTLVRRLPEVFAPGSYTKNQDDFVHGVPSVVFCMNSARVIWL